MILFSRYVGIDYSGAETAESSLKGLRVYQADVQAEPREVEPPVIPRKYWTRRGIAEWLCEELSWETPTLVGIDHRFSFPLAYFDKQSVKHDWSEFLDDFQQHWPTDDLHTYVDFVRDVVCGRGAMRTGDAQWLRFTERWTATAKSVFRFDVSGSVAKSTHAGLPWLRYLRQHCQRSIHFWPFDGWNIPAGVSVVAEVYPSLWMKRFPQDDRDGDQQAAYAAAAWMKRADRNGSLATFLEVHDEVAVIARQQSNPLALQHSGQKHALRLPAELALLLYPPHPHRAVVLRLARPARIDARR